MTKYFGIWEDVAGLRNDFDIGDDAIEDSEVLFASYEYESYEGSAFVLFERDSKPFEVNGGHCSCYGLEGQWEPEETTWGALAMREFSTYEFPHKETLEALVKSRQANRPRFADAVLYRPMVEEDGEAGKFVVELRKRLYETTKDLTAKIQSLLEEHVFCEDGSYTFPDGDVWLADK